MPPDTRAKMLVAAVQLQMLAAGTHVRMPTVRAVGGENSHFDPKAWHIDIGHPALRKNNPSIEEFAAACEHARHEMEHVLIEFRIIRLEAMDTKRRPETIARRWKVSRDAVEDAVRANQDSSAEPLTSGPHAQQTADFHDLIRGDGAKEYRRISDAIRKADKALTAAKEALAKNATPEAQAKLEAAQKVWDEANEAYLDLADERVAWRAGEQAQGAVEQYLDLQARTRRARETIATLRPVLETAMSANATAEVIQQLTDAVNRAEAFLEFATKKFAERGQAMP
jgi:hypothetical protein